MSTYLVADAINNFAKTFKKSMEERNKIEKDKLELEKSKFEFYKALEEEKFKLNKQQMNSNIEPTNCNHNWQYKTNYYSEEKMCYVSKYECIYCGETKEECLGFFDML